METIKTFTGNGKRSTVNEGRGGFYVHLENTLTRRMVPMSAHYKTRAAAISKAKRLVGV